MRERTSIAAVVPPSRISGLIVSALCVFLWWVSLPARAQTDASNLRVQILNGRTGRPVANHKIVLTGKEGLPSHAKNFGSEMTDGEGYAPLPNVDTSTPSLTVLVEGSQPCSKTNNRAFSLAKVRSAGVVSENSCRPRITMFPQQGTLIFFVRPETLIEKMRH